MIGIVNNIFGRDAIPQNETSQVFGLFFIMATHLRKIFSSWRNDKLIEKVSLNWKISFNAEEENWSRSNS